MAYHGKYDHDRDQYKHSCGELQCPRHGRGACRQRYHEKKKALHSTWGFTTVILFFNYKPSSRSISQLRPVIRKHIKRWDRDAKICMVLHPKKKCWHLNIGIQSKWVFRMKNRHWWGQYVEEQVVGYWDGKKQCRPRGRPRVADFDRMVKELEAEIQHLCANSAINRRRPPRLEAGEFRNQPKQWLWYVLRCKSGWKKVEKLPRRMGYRLTSGFVVRRKKPAAASTDASSSTEPRFSRDVAGCLLLLAMAWLIAQRPLSPSTERDWCSCCPECLVATLPPTLLRPKARSPPRPCPIART
jgi:hypothetical protein